MLCYWIILSNAIFINPQVPEIESLGDLNSIEDYRRELGFKNS